MKKALLYPVYGADKPKTTTFTYQLQKQSKPDGTWDVVPHVSRNTTTSLVGHITTAFVDVNGDGQYETAVGSWRQSGMTKFQPPFALPDPGVDHYTYRRFGKIVTAKSLQDIPSSMQI